MPDLTHDWITQSALAELLGISERTASLWAAAGRLREFEHGCRQCGRRKYSRQLVERAIDHQWQEAVARQDELLNRQTGA
jgi:predicted site-specific integrase-resolvase